MVARVRLKDLGRLARQVPDAPAPAPRPTRKRAKPTLLEAGTVLARFVVLGEPVPWRAPDVMRGHGRKPAHVKRWQETVAQAAHDAGFGQAKDRKSTRLNSSHPSISY